MPASSQQTGAQSPLSAFSEADIINAEIIEKPESAQLSFTVRADARNNQSINNSVDSEELPKLSYDNIRIIALISKTGEFINTTTDSIATLQTKEGKTIKLKNSTKFSDIKLGRQSIVPFSDLDSYVEVSD